MSAPKPIQAITQIIAARRLLGPQAVRALHSKARHYSIHLDSLMWLMLDQYPDGSRRSPAYIDAPGCVSADGLIVERFAPGVEVAAWRLTDKGRAILNAVRAG